MTMTGSYALARLLKKHGVQFVTGIHGFGTQHIISALRNVDIPFIQVISEQSAIQIADGYFRACGRVMCAVIPTSISVSNTLSGIATACADSSALLLLSGGQISHIRHDDEEDEGYSNYPDMDCSSSTKSLFRVASVQKLPSVILRSLNIMTTGRPGPVCIEMTVNVQRMRGEPEMENAHIRKFSNVLKPDNESVEQALELLLRAKRPLILAGGGVIVSEASEMLKDLAETLSIPVATTLNGKGAFPEDHYLFAGSIGKDGSANGNTTLEKADVLISFGSRLAHNINFSTQTRLIQIDIDQTEIGRNHPVEIGIITDAGNALVDFNMRLSQTKTRKKSPDREKYIEDIIESRKAWITNFAETFYHENSPLTVQRLLAELRGTIDHDAIIVVGPGEIQSRVYQLFPVYLPRTHITSGSFSAQGWALPAAIGARLAMPARQVICIVTDSDFMQSMHELSICVMHTLPVVFLVVAHTYDTKKTDTHKTKGMRMPDGKPYNPAFADIARGFGLEAWAIEHVSQLKKILLKAINCNGPTVIEVRVEENSSDDNNSAEHAFPSSAYLSASYKSLII